MANSWLGIEFIFWGGNDQITQGVTAPVSKWQMHVCVINGKCLLLDLDQGFLVFEFI